MTENSKISATSATGATPAAECEEVAAVAKRAWRGIVTIAVAVCVAVVTLGFVAAALLVSGFIPLSGLEGRISTAIEERLGPNWKVTAEQAELDRVDGRSRLRVREVSFRHASGASFRAPEAVLGYDAMSLLRGNIRLVSLDLRGVNIRLGVRQDGSLLLEQDAQPEQVSKTPVAGDPVDWDAFAGAMNAIGALVSNEGLLGSLEVAGIGGARVTLIDPAGRQRSGLEDVDVRLERFGGGQARLSMKGRIGPRWKELAIDLSNAPDGTRNATIDIQRFEPAEAVALAFGNAMVALDGMALSGKISLTQAGNGERKFAAGLTVAPGVVRVHNAGLDPIEVQGAKLDFTSEDGLKTIKVATAELQAGETKLAGSGQARNEGGIWRLELDGGGQVAGIGKDAAVAISSLHTQLDVDPGAGEIRLGRLSFKGPLINAEGSGMARRRDEQNSHQFQIRAVDTDMRAALAVWPAVTSPGLHGALSEMVQSGRVEEIDVKVTMSPEANMRLASGKGMDNDAVAVKLKASQVSFLPNPGLPLLTDARVVGSTTGRTVDLVIPQATAELGDGRKLTLSEGTFAMSDTWADRPQAQMSFRSTGSADALVALLNFPSLREFSPLKIEPGALRGAIDLTSQLSLPLVNDLQFADVLIRSSGALSNVASDNLLGGEKLEGANLALTYDRGQLSIKGEGKVGGDKAPIDLKQNAKGQGEATVSLSLDNAALKRRGFGPETGISGPVQVKVVKPLGKTPEAPPRVEVDLTRAAIDSGVPGVSKPAGRAGKAAFTYVVDADGPDLEDLTIESAPLLAKGRISLTKQNTFESASFSQLRLSPGDNLTKVEIGRDGNLTKLSVRGAVLDARPFIRDLFDAPAAPTRGARGGQSAASGPDFDLDLDVPILTGFNNEALGNSQLKLSRRNGALRSVAYQGRIGKADLSIKQARQGEGAGQLVVQSENGGATLRFLDLYRRAYGGDLILQLGAGEGRQPGELLLRNFTVRDEPALRRVVGPPGSQAPNALDSTGAPAPRIDASDVAFTKLKAEFVRSASRIDISDAVLWGQQVGFTIQGSVDYGRDRVDIGGTFVPGYAFNNAFAQVPVVGMILGGGQYGGLFAVNFRVSGSASQPTMTVNPLSAIAPGILRRFVDPLGGGPLEQARPGARVPAPGAAER
ncbi:AsmA-like C-terminal region-containing protein [Boseaceae bacterium BT-24-1]|nr:AsmA-like C-terminal region-containing protein [Boseaceae bacterium BT-24-1]